MHLKYITCSDPREFNDIHDIVELAHTSPRTEIAVQAHPSKMSPGMPRYEWFRELLQYVLRENDYKVNLAVHVNREYCDEICRTGKIPTELKDFFDLRYCDTYHPLIRRWQLNIPKETAMNTKVRKLAKLFREKEDYRFIVQYNGHTDHIVHDLFNRVVNNVFYCRCPKFSVLYDASGGRGILPDTWRAPLFACIPQGYSGGLSPENVQSNLDKINSVVPANRDIWIDAEGKLKTNDMFDINRARQYIFNAESWLTKQKQK